MGEEGVCFVCEDILFLFLFFFFVRVGVFVIAGVVGMKDFGVVAHEEREEGVEEDEGGAEAGICYDC